MIDRYDLGANEVVIVDTTQNSIIVVLVSGAVDIVDPNLNIVAVLSSPLEMYTLPIGSGRYTIRDLSGASSTVLGVRYFVY